MMDKQSLITFLWKVAENTKESAGTRLKAVASLRAYDNSHPVQPSRAPDSWVTFVLHGFNEEAYKKEHAYFQARDVRLAAIVREIASCDDPARCSITDRIVAADMMLAWGLSTLAVKA